MIHRVVAVVFFIIIAPMTVFSMEQRFTQNGLATTIKLDPDQPIVGKEVSLKVRTEHDGQVVTDRQVTLEVYAQDGREPIIKRGVDVLDGEYVDSWAFEKPGEYKVVLNIADPKVASEALHYEIKASVGAAEEGKHEKHGFLEHHFKSHWGWWGGGLMLLMMVPMMILL